MGGTYQGKVKEGNVGEVDGKGREDSKCRGGEERKGRYERSLE